MFGYVIPNREALSAEEEKRYKAFYCGLCEALKRRHGAACRFTLTYDMAFLAILLTSLKDEDAESLNAPCPRHPVKDQRCMAGPLLDYAADMNVLMTYYQLKDDWQDDRSPAALTGIRLLAAKIPAIEKAYPKQAAALHENLKALSLMETKGETNPDLPAACFGRIMGELFAFGGLFEDRLRCFGEALGRLIYLMDAACDFTRDIKKERYNPLIAIPSVEHEAMLRLLSAACARLFDALPVKRDKRLMENILYSGVWTRFQATQPKGGKNE